MSAERLPRRTGRPTDAEAAERDAAYPISRVTPADMPALGPWLISRIMQKWPQFRRELWVGKLTGFMSSNDCLFVKNDRAVLLLTATPRLMDGALVIQEAFAFSCDSVPDKHRPGEMMLPRDAAMPLVLLYRHGKMWAHSKRAERMFIGQCSDLEGGELRGMLSALRCGWTAVPL